MMAGHLGLLGGIFDETHSLFRSLFVAACAALLATNLTTAESPRERLSLDARWEFHLSIRFQAARASIFYVPDITYHDAKAGSV